MNCAQQLPRVTGLFQQRLKVIFSSVPGSVGVGLIYLEKIRQLCLQGCRKAAGAVEGVHENFRKTAVRLGGWGGRGGREKGVGSRLKEEDGEDR